MDRFLQYSLQKGRKIRVMLLMDGHMTQSTVLVLSLSADYATLQPGGKKKPLCLPLCDILSCDYARGDHGED